MDDLDEKERERKEKEERCVIIKGAGSTIEKAHIQLVFGHVGDIVQVKKQYDLVTGEHVWFVEYRKASYAKDAVEKHQGYELCGDRLCIFSSVWANDAMTGMQQPKLVEAQPEVAKSTAAPNAVAVLGMGLMDSTLAALVDTNLKDRINANERLIKELLLEVQHNAKASQTIQLRNCLVIRNVDRVIPLSAVQKAIELLTVLDGVTPIFLENPPNATEGPRHIIVDVSSLEVSQRYVAQQVLRVHVVGRGDVQLPLAYCTEADRAIRNTAAPLKESKEKKEKRAKDKKDKDKKERKKRDKDRYSDSSDDSRRRRRKDK